MLKIPARFKQCDLSVSLAFDYCDCIVNMGTRAAACKILLPYMFKPQFLIFYFLFYFIYVSIMRNYFAYFQVPTRTKLTTYLLLSFFS